ncbi:MAG: type II toxin-antitoxin system VapC family toxin [Actinomycetota bacterium]|nr:type II toxin-antitoxin system VapC family toxin [Actinomycetota bacterium]
MRVYLDTSAVLKRVIEEPESTSLVAYLSERQSEGSPLVSSSLTWIEASRALLRGGVGDALRVDGLATAALSGVAERPVTGEVVALARRLGPSSLRSLDAIHLASALAVDADVVLTYDDRLAEAVESHGLRTLAPATWRSGHAENGE